MKIKVKAYDLDTVMDGYEVELEIPITEEDIQKLDAIYWQEGYDIDKLTCDCREAIFVEFCERYNKNWDKYIEMLVNDKFSYYFVKEQDRHLFTEEEYRRLCYYRNQLYKEIECESCKKIKQLLQELYK